MKTRIITLSKRMDRLDKFVKKHNNSLTCQKWSQYFRLFQQTSSEYADLISK